MFKRNKHLLTLLLALATSACHKKHPNTLEGTPVQINVLVMGQSNAQNLSGGGYQGFRSVYSNAQFINCAMSGTSLAAWTKGGSLYSNCQSLVGNTHIDMILWIQGENEAEGRDCGCQPGQPCSCLAPAENWSQNFTTIARNCMTDFKAPVFFSRLGNIPNPGPYWDEVRLQQMQTTIGTMVSLDGIDPITGDIHYWQPGYYEIGARFAMAKKIS